MTPTSAQDDLAFLRALADGDVARRQQHVFGKIYFGAGLIYGAQVAASIVMNFGVLAVPGGDLTLSLVANVVFLSWMVWELRKTRGESAGTMTNRAINAAFGAVGAANLAVCLILVAGAVQLQNLLITVLIPCVIFALQGTAWFVAYLLRRRGWLGAVALGWTVCGVGMALSVNHVLVFLGFIAAGIAFCMALPGYVMMRLAARGDA